MAVSRKALVVGAGRVMVVVEVHIQYMGLGEVVVVVVVLYKEVVKGEVGSS